MKTAVLKKVIVATALSILSWTGYAENRIDTQLPDAPELAGYGSNSIGVRTLELLNADQLDILKIQSGQPKPRKLPRYDRPLTVEVWYPAKQGETGDTELKVYLRDAKTEVKIAGKAMRGATPADGKYPLIIVSHGHPGNRYLMSH